MLNSKIEFSDWRRKKNLYLKPPEKLQSKQFWDNYLTSLGHLDKNNLFFQSIFTTDF